MKFAVVTDENVARIYGLEGAFVVPAGEGTKRLAVVEGVMGEMVRRGCGRETTVVGMGGGVVCDLAGFVANVFCRGVPLILVPTTLLAMVDAAVGGKVAVNLEEGKNLVGAYCVPEKVVVHLKFLETLPEIEWENGAVEILKMGLLGDEELFWRFSEFSVGELVSRAVEGKRRIVAQDFREKGKRKVLNLGHTVGHALETVSGYEVSHGRAVAMGIVLEARMAHKMGVLPGSELRGVEKGFPEVRGCVRAEEVMAQMKRDKKGKDGEARFVLLEKVGVPYVKGGEFVHRVPEEVMREVLEEV